MKISNLFGSGGADRLRKEAADARRTIEQAAPGDAVNFNGDRQLLREQGGLWQGRANPKGMTAIKAEKDSSVVLREEVVKESNRGLQVAAGIAGTLIGVALFGGKKKDSGAGALAGVLLGGLAAWGAGKASEVVKKNIDRVETTPEGVSSERLSEGPDGNSYSGSYKRTAPPEPVDVEKSKEYIASLKLD
ncbi:hypothetical protein JST97_34190 [bacterium]|nr:hypothetical protein [bacterium]